MVHSSADATCGSTVTYSTNKARCRRVAATDSVVRLLAAAILPGTALFFFLCLAGGGERGGPSPRALSSAGRGTNSLARLGGTSAMPKAPSPSSTSLEFETLSSHSQFVPQERLTGTALSLSSNSAPRRPLRSVHHNTTRGGNRVSRWTATSPCARPNCLNFLTPRDREMYDRCIETVHTAGLSDTVKHGNCTFINGRGRGAVALASIPGSGSAWVRELLEAATGICTGASNCDISLRAAGFEGEGLNSGATLVVNTHRETPFWSGYPKPAALRRLKDEASFSSAVVLLRNPFHALVSEWRERVAGDGGRGTRGLEGHVESIDRKWFGNRTGWNEFVIGAALHWQNLVINWIVGGARTHPLLVVHYESLEHNTVAELSRILDFLKVPNSHYDLEKLKGGLGELYRKHPHTKDHRLFTTEQRLYVCSLLHETEKLAQSFGQEDLGLQEYLRLHGCSGKRPRPKLNQ